MFFNGYACQSMVDKIAEASVFGQLLRVMLLISVLKYKGEILLIEVNNGYVLDCYELFILIQTAVRYPG